MAPPTRAPTSPASSPAGRSSPTSGLATIPPETNGVVERFNGSIKYEHLFRLEIPDAITLADEAEAFRRLYNEVRPHESLDFATPLSAYLDDPDGSNLFGPWGSVQDS